MLRACRRRGGRGSARASRGAAVGLLFSWVRRMRAWRDAVPNNGCLDDGMELQVRGHTAVDCDNGQHLHVDQPCSNPGG